MTPSPTLTLINRYTTRRTGNRPTSAGGGRRLRLLAYGAALVLASCSGEESPATQDCETLDVTQPTFRRIELDDGLSSDLCPPIELNVVQAAQDAGAPPCEVQQRNCAMDVECQMEGILAQGELDIAGGQATGFIRIRKPIHCEYWLEVEFP